MNKIKVTLRIDGTHIRRGKVSCLSCPVSLAFNDIGYFAWIETHQIMAYRKTDSGKARSFRTTVIPVVLKEFITKFDRGDIVEPLRVDLELEEIE
jgi:hypothetical protein